GIYDRLVLTQSRLQTPRFFGCPREPEVRAVEIRVDLQGIAEFDRRLVVLVRGQILVAPVEVALLAGFGATAADQSCRRCGNEQSREDRGRTHRKPRYDN